MFDKDLLAILFASDGQRTTPCRCHQRGYCPRHGTYEPVVQDPAVLESIAEDTRPSMGGTRIIRKRLAN